MIDVLDRVEGKLVYAADVLDLFYVASAGQDKAFIAIVEDVVENTPTADVQEVKHGEWLYNRGQAPGEPLYYCSLCIDGGSDWGKDNFCPHCGAKMDGGTN